MIKQPFLKITRKKDFWRIETKNRSGTLQIFKLLLNVSGFELDLRNRMKKKKKIVHNFDLVFSDIVLISDNKKK